MYNFSMSSIRSDGFLRVLVDVGNAATYASGHVLFYVLAPGATTTTLQSGRMPQPSNYVLIESTGALCQSNFVYTLLVALNGVHDIKLKKDKRGSFLASISRALRYLCSPGHGKSAYKSYSQASSFRALLARSGVFCEPPAGGEYNNTRIEVRYHALSSLLSRASSLEGLYTVSKHMRVAELHRLRAIANHLTDYNYLY